MKPDCMAQFIFVIDIVFTWVCRWQERFGFQACSVMSQRSRSEYFNSGCMAYKANISNTYLCSWFMVCNDYLNGVASNC